MFFIRVIPTDEIKKESRGKADNRYEVDVQVCDMHIPGERNPRDFSHLVKGASDMLDPKKVYYIGGTSFGVDRWGAPEINRFEMQFIEESEIIKYFAKGVKTATAA